MASEEPLGFHWNKSFERENSSLPVPPKQRDKVSPSEKEQIRLALVQRDGRRCKICNQDPIGGLEIDHVNNNPLDWGIQNLRLLCGLCNKQEAWRHRKLRSLKEREKIGDNAIANAVLENRLEELAISWEGRRKLELQDIFEPLLDRLLATGSLTVKDAQNRLAKLTGADQQTVTRWIDRETTPEGKYQLSSRQVQDNRRWRTLQFISRRT